MKVKGFFFFLIFHKVSILKTETRDLRKNEETKEYSRDLEFKFFNNL
jgi:hypothetical protein